MTDTAALLEQQMQALPPFERESLRLKIDYVEKARWNQLPPNGDWSTWCLIAGRGFGKALSTTTPIMTPESFTCMGDLRAGDEVLDEHGNPCKVVVAHPVIYGNRCLRINFDGANPIIADVGHLWRIHEDGRKPVVMTTLAVKDMILIQGRKPWILREMDGKRFRITGTDWVPSVPVRCITVDSPSSLFQAGSGGVPTHNTWSGANYIAQFGLWNPGTRIAIIGRTFKDVRDTMFEGKSGVLSCVPENGYKWNRSLLELRLDNGTIFFGYTSESPEALRGPEHHAYWADEVGAWINTRESWDNLQMGLRLGKQPHGLITTTPRKNKVLKEIYDDPTTVKTNGTTYDNASNLPDSFFKQLTKYEGTDKARQELLGQFIEDDTEILPRRWWKVWTEAELPKIEQVVLSWDTAFKARKTSDYTAFTAWGLFRHDYDEEVELEGGNTVVVKRSRWCVMLLDGWKDKVGYPAMRAAVQKEYDKWSKVFSVEDGDEPPLNLIEDKGSGQSVIQELQHAGVPVYPFNPGHDSKKTRAQLVSDLLKDGLVWCFGRLNEDKTERAPDRCPRWAESIIKELDDFTGIDDDVEDGDDMIDSCGQAWSWFRSAGYLQKSSDRDYNAYSPYGDQEEDISARVKSGRRRFYG